MPDASWQQPTWLTSAEPIVDCGVYIDGGRLAGAYSPATARDAVHEAGRGFVWLGLHQPDRMQMQALADVFGLHPLVVEHAVNTYRRPALERYDDTLLLVLKTVNYVPGESVSATGEIVQTGEIMICLAPDFVITIRHGSFGGLAALRTELQADPGFVAPGPGAVLYAVVAHVIESYRAVLSLIEVDVDAIRDQMMSVAGPGVDVEQIYLLKRETVELRRGIAPLSAALTLLLVDHRDVIPGELTIYLRRVIEREREAAERVTGLDGVVSELVDGALGRIGLQQNNDMRAIAGWGALAAVVTVVTGIYGMRFAHMPELHWAYSYPVALILMASVCAALYLRFRGNRWL